MLGDGNLMSSTALRALGASLVLVVAAWGAPLVAQTREQITVGVSQFPPQLHPGIGPTTAKQYVLSAVRRDLFAMDEEWKPICRLCTEVPSLANGRLKLVDLPGGGKGMTLAVTIKPDMKWADGVPVTSKDVAFSLELGKQPDMGFSNSDAYAVISQIDVIDDRNFVMRLSAVRPNIDRVNFVILPEHIEGPIYRGLTDQKDYQKLNAYNRAPTTPGLYNGPYRITQVETGQFFRLERNPHWNGPKPHFERVIIRTIENTSALEQNLLSGDIDFVAGELGFSLDQVLSLSKRMPDRFNYVFVPGMYYEFMPVNLDNPILADKRVRQALLMAIDRETLVKRLFEGRNPVAHSWLHPKEQGHDPDAKKYPFDPAAARKLLEEAGFRPGAGGIRQNAAGQRLSFDYATTAGNKQRELVQQVVQSQMKDIGVELVIKNEPARSFFGQAMRERRFTALGQYAASPTPDYPPLRNLHSASIPTSANNFSGTNYAGFRNAEMDALITDMLSELDPAKRKAGWKRMQAIYVEELPGLPLYFNSEPYALPKWLSGLTPPSNGDTSTIHIELWRAN